MIIQVTEKEQQLTHVLKEITGAFNRAVERINELEREKHEATNAALERAAVVCDEYEYEYWRTQEDQEFTPADCAAAIRALKEMK